MWLVLSASHSTSLSLQQRPYGQRQSQGIRTRILLCSSTPHHSSTTCAIASSSHSTARVNRLAKLKTKGAARCGQPLFFRVKANKPLHYVNSCNNILSIMIKTHARYTFKKIRTVYKWQGNRRAERRNLHKREPC